MIHDKCELEPINEELENSVAKLLSENERLCNEINHVKQVFKDQFASIKQTRVRHKEHSDSLIIKLNLKSVENEDLKAQIQDKVFVITSLENDLRKLKGKEIVKNVVHLPSATTISTGMFKLDLVLLPPRLLQNREAHIDYLRQAQEQANTLQEIVEQAKVKQPLDRELDFSFPRTPQKNGVVERRNRTLVEAARIMLIFSKASMFLWTEAVATACYTQNRSLIHTRHYKTPYELVHDKKPDLTFFRVFGALCYPTNDSEDLGKLQPTTDIGIFVGYAPSRKGYRIYNKRTRRIMETIHVQFDELTEQMAPMQLSTGPAPTYLMPGQISSRLVPNPVPAAPYVPPTNKELDILFQPIFDEYMEPPRVERPVSPAPAVSVPVNSAGTPSSTTIDQDAPSPSHSSSSSAVQSPSLHKGVTADSTLMKDNPFAPVDNHPFINTFALAPSSEASSSRDLNSAESPYVSQTLHNLGK
ncbi:retrovirus-related pol polyprotein from transposon TNT 1-94 [Tanacetum coccineum]